MSKIFVPEKSEMWCTEVYSDYIRIYKNNNGTDENGLTNYSYTDYFINSHYNWSNGNVNVDGTQLRCTNIDDLSTNVLYRNDITDIFIIVLVILFFIKFFFGRLLRKVF